MISDAQSRGDIARRDPARLPLLELADEFGGIFAVGLE
jgi:hypothetical protein